MSAIRINQAIQYIDKRIKVNGWIHRIRVQSKSLIFIILRDGQSYLQTVLAGELAKTELARTLQCESSIAVWGMVHRDERAGKNKDTAQDPIELRADHWELIGSSPDTIESIMRADTSVHKLLDNRHLLIRGTNASQVLRARAFCMHILRQYLFQNWITEITPPSLVQTQVEGNSSLFSVKYFDETAYLTQSSQLYLETVLPAVGDAYCMTSSFRAEETHTRRHLAEFTHLEVEYAFITFENLLNNIEDLIIHVMTQMAKYSTTKIPKKPFKRMTYHQAIDFCNKNGIYKEEPFKDGDEIKELEERRMTDLINEPIFLINFPTKMKPFYMSKLPSDKNLTESVDLLYPGVGEIVGGSMRETNAQTLLTSFKEAGLNPEKYYWYLDQRKYGTQPHGGFGLGLERFLMVILGLDHVRSACLYPRIQGRCKP